MSITRNKPTFSGSLLALPPEPETDGNENDYERIASDSNEGLNDYESPHSDDEDDNEYYSSDFESDDEGQSENGNDFEQENSEINIDLENGISLITNSTHLDILNRFRTIHMNVFDRNLNLKVFELSDGRQFASDIFKIILRCRIHNPRQCDFSFSDDMAAFILFKVPVLSDIFPSDHNVVKQLYEFFVTFNDGASWEERRVEYKDGFVYFSCCKLSSFCILSRPRKIPQVICPQGAIIRTGADGKLMVKFPPGWVTEEKKIEYQVFRPAITNLEEVELYWKPQMLVSISETINISYSRKDPIYLSFPKHSTHDRPGTEKKLIEFKNGRPRFLPMVTIVDNNETLYEVRKCKSVALAVVYANNSNSVVLLKKEVDIFYGIRILCSILLFGKSTRDGLELLASVALQSEVEITKEEASAKEFNLIYQSDATCFSPLQRIRIHLSGQLKAINGLSQENYFFTFVSKSKHNTISFPVRLRTEGQSYGILEFLNDKYNRGKRMAEVHFDTFAPFKLRRIVND